MFCVSEESAASAAFFVMPTPNKQSHRQCITGVELAVFNLAPEVREPESPPKFVQHSACKAIPTGPWQDLEAKEL